MTKQTMSLSKLDTEMWIFLPFTKSMFISLDGLQIFPKSMTVIRCLYPQVECWYCVVTKHHCIDKVSDQVYSYIMLFMNYLQSHMFIYTGLCL